MSAGTADACPGDDRKRSVACRAADPYPDTPDLGTAHDAACAATINRAKSR